MSDLCDRATFVIIMRVDIAMRKSIQHMMEQRYGLCASCLDRCRNLRAAIDGHAARHSARI
ncbi:hypothetical protein BST65_32485 [Bradyrhizobium canariense]|nr:hypothetical protein BST65_32485 [Bradyrhizobium canariense]OSI33410.1 hypothetical protein BST66_13455 [Bradyrhizobium canariense]OSI39630.1 hypothetical protein BSZ20_29320 [Bradyrhizobium canariense]OSI47653.1 hypothetical protein BST67_19800 [Bradyrhizobium canariense]OSI55997.1 hypothetical protein BSZ15_18300 [Bradyrhizobium canariense]